MSDADPVAGGESARLTPLLRYRGIVDDLDALLAACARPLPRVVWANPLRAPIEQTARRLQAAIPAADRLEWHPAAWRLPPDSRPGNLVEYRLGHLHAQEEAALWAVPMLGALPGDRVLDLCAAPGNKSAQLAIAVGPHGSVLANERYRGRVDALRFNLDRLGITNTVVTNRDGLSPKLGLPPFDRVLADVPCSCEGTARKPSRRPRDDDDGWRATVVQVQTGLLRSALAHVKPGGTVLYATCTFAPEENEGVLSAIDEAQAVIEKMELPPGLVFAPGIPEWRGRIFRSDIANAVRLWPHHNNTGGFFVARLRRL